MRQDGPRDAPALLLIHGNASSARWWDELVPMLTRSHYVIRLDLLGYGRSAKPEGRSYALPDQACRVGAAMDRLGIERVVVAGHSSGGAAATALAEKRPDLVAALVLISTGPHLGAHIAPPRDIDPSQWPHVTDEQLRQFTSAAFSRPGYQIPLELLDEVRAMTFHSLTTTMQASRDYLEEQALPDRLATLGKPLRKWLLPVGDGKVTQLKVDHAFTLVLESWIEIRIETRFSYGAAGDARQFEPSDALGLAPLLGLHRATVISAEVRKDGRLTLVFADGCELAVPPDERYEAFTVTGSLPVRRGFSFTAVPGGGLARY